MNERIKEIERWCFKEIPVGLNGKYIAMEFDRQKFAELIIQECAILADQYNFEKNQGTINPLKTTAYEFIKEHFGVEE